MRRSAPQPATRKTPTGGTGVVLAGVRRFRGEGRKGVPKIVIRIRRRGLIILGD
jgi:hypothetical protein